jgi:hypothetical protein
MDGDEFVIVLLCLLVVALVAVMVVDVFNTGPYVVSGEVVDKEYTPATSGIQSVIVDGKPSIMYVSSSAEWMLVIRTKQGLEMHEVSQDVYYSTSIGDFIQLPCREGQLLGTIYCK